MDVREKLIELLKTNACPAPFMCDPACRYYGFGDCFPDRFADYLIANGVTVQENVKMSDELLKQLKNAPITICKEEPSIEVVQEWISVNDRLPEEKVNCIVYYKHAYCDNDDYWAIGICFYNGEKFQMDWLYKVTHWIPLPKPPKGAYK